MKTIKVFKKEIISRNSDSSIFIGNLVDEILEFAEHFIPIEEEPPPHHTKILVIDSISKSESFGQFSQNMEWFHCHKSTNVFAKSDITHWRPLFRK